MILAAELCAIAAGIGIWAMVGQTRAIDAWGNAASQWLGKQPVLPTIVRGITHLGDAATIIIVTLLVILYRIMAQRKGLLRGAFPAFSTLGAWGSGQIIKHIVGRMRPAIEHLIYETGASFPSNHATTSMGVYPLLGWWLGGTPKQRRAFAMIGVLLSLCIGASRVLLGVHYVSDVLAGWCIGAASTILWIAFTADKEMR